VERPVDQRADAHEFQAGGDLFQELRLRGQRDVGIARGDQLGRHGRVGGGDQRDVQILGGIGADLLRHQDGRVVGIDEPVQQYGEVIARHRALHESEKAQRCGDGAHQKAEARVRTAAKPGPM